MGFIPGNTKREGHRKEPYFVPPWAHHCLLQEKPKEGKDRVHLSQDPGPITYNPHCHALQGSQHAVGKALPYPESPRYSHYISNEGITERGDNAGMQSSGL